MKSFGNYVDYKDRENKTHLKILKDIFSKAGFEVVNKLDDPKEPYFYVKKTKEAEKLSFGGIRVYSRGKTVCFRPQMKPDVEPFGGARAIDVEDMYKTFIDEKKGTIGYKIIFNVIKEIRNFFVDSLAAERESEGDMGRVFISGGGGSVQDYANSVATNRQMPSARWMG